MKTKNVEEHLSYIETIHKKICSLWASKKRYLSEMRKSQAEILQLEKREQSEQIKCLLSKLRVHISACYDQYEPFLSDLSTQSRKLNQQLNELCGNIEGQQMWSRAMIAAEKWREIEYICKQAWDLIA